MNVNTILLVVALIAFALAAIGFTWRKTDLIAIGLAVWSLSLLIGRLSSLNLSTILLILALVAFVLSAVGWRYRKLNLIAIGLALWVLSLLI
jgi:hypothetical protein